MRVSCAVGLPNVGEFGDPRVLSELAVAAEEHGWDGVFLWDHLLYHDRGWPVANPTVALAAIAARTGRVRLGPLMTALPRRRVQVVAREEAMGWWRGGVPAARSRIAAGPPSPSSRSSLRPDP